MMNSKDVLSDLIQIFATEVVGVKTFLVNFVAELLSVTLQFFADAVYAFDLIVGMKYFSCLSV